MNRPTVDAGAGAFPWIVAGVGATVGVWWVGGAMAALAAGSGVPALGEGAAALANAASHAGDPTAMWSGRPMPPAALFWLCELAGLAVTVAVAVATLVVGRAFLRERRQVVGVDAEPGFARPRDVRELIVPEETPGRLTVGTLRGRLIACEEQASLAVIGPTGCGKTAGFAIPALLEWRGPVLATSVKADLLERSLDHRRSRGRVWVYDPTGTTGVPSCSWSPIAACSTWRGALRVAAWMTEATQPRMDSVTDGDYWYSQARKGLAPYLHAAAIADVGVDGLATWVDAQEEDAVERWLQRSDGASPDDWLSLRDESTAIMRDLLSQAGGRGLELAEQPWDEWPRWLRDNVDDAVDVEWQLERREIPASSPLIAARALWRKESRLRGSVFATMENVVSSWADPGVGDVGATSDIDFDEWLSGDNTIYVVAPSHEQARLRPVLTVLVQQAIRHAFEAAGRAGGSLPRPCLALLDEAGNIAPLRDLPAYAATARSHGISFVSIWQDLAQIRSLYRDRADTVLNNHRAKLFGAGIGDTSTLEYVSRLIGDEQRLERTQSADITSGRRSVSEHRQYRRVAPVEVVRRLRGGEALLLYGREVPAHVRLRPWFDDARLRARAGEERRARVPA